MDMHSRLVFSIQICMKDNLLTSRTLKIAGWLCMISAFFALPLVYLSFRLEGLLDYKSTTLQVIIQMYGTFIFVAVTLYLKRLLNTIYNFRNTDRNIDLMIITGILTGILSVAALFFTSFKEAVGSAVIVIFVLQGIVQFQLGYKLLKLPGDLNGILKPFCYANMLTGLCLASIVLIPLGILASAISDLMLGTIFLNMARSFNDNIRSTVTEE